jgi:two-component system sensor histidine kinase HydH
MSQRVVRRIALPMIGLGLVLSALGIAAAWNVHKQQNISSELIAMEVSGVIAIEELHLEMREIRYQINLFLRTQNLNHLVEVARAHDAADELLATAKSLARADQEQELILKVERGYSKFFREFQTLSEKLPASKENSAAMNQRVEISPELQSGLTHLSDEILTDEVLLPLKECISVNKQVVARTNAASQMTAQHLKIGFLLLGLCGGAAGLLMGTVIARAVGQSIVQLDISVRGVAGLLPELLGPVKFSRVGDLEGLEAGLKTVEENISSMVERLQQQEIEILRSEQLARVGQLAAGMAHELRNPLMPMKMLVQAALERKDGEGLKGRSLQIIQDEISRLEKSIQAFLDFARPPIPVKENVAIQDIVQQAFDLVSARANSQAITITLEQPLEHVVLCVDRHQIHQLLLNLILNAMDVLPQAGDIIVSVTPLRLLSPEQSNSSTPSPSHDFYDISEHQAMRIHRAPSKTEMQQVLDWVSLKVTDSGPGIPLESLDKIFDPFVTTKETGTGLGLTICQRIAASHQGTLKAANSPTGGAVFSVLLPCLAS